MEAFLWMLYSYSCLILAILSLMTSLFGPEVIALKDDKLSTFFSMGFILIFIVLLCLFMFFQNILMTILLFGTQVLTVFLNKQQWPWSQIFLVFICSLCSVPYFSIVYRNFGTIREKSLIKPRHARYLNSIGASMNMSLETKTDFGLYDSALQNAMGHALASYGWTRKTQFVFAICTALAAGRFLLEFRHISAPPPTDRVISDLQHRDADLAAISPVTIEP